MNTKRRIAAWIAALGLCASMAPALPASADYGVGGNGTAIMEYLDRGIYAVKSGSGTFVSWRWNADDPDDAEFRLYRDGKLIYTSKSGDPTCYQDNATGGKYRVDCLSGGKVISSEECRFSSGTNYFDIKLNSPGAQYSPNDCSVGDVDGDGQYEIFLKWDPSNSKDNSQDGVTDNVFIDCYTLTGKQLWRIDMGKNIRAGQHYTQMCVADFDCDGRAELITKTADGTKDGKGKVIGDGSKVYRNGAGRILTGPEFLTLFDGQTGAALDTIDFPVARGQVTKATWGDDYGNRVDRMNSGIAYLDGVHPSALYGRGYYTRLTVSAVDVRDGKLVKRWVYDTGFDKKTPGWGCGNHNMMAADSDNDGKQEVFMGASAIDDNGKLLWTTGQLHGDAMHLGDLIPDRPGLELWECHEDNPFGESCIDAKTGKVIFHINNTKDTGRCAADNVWAGNKGAEFWGAADGNVYDQSGKKIGGTRPAQNFFIYWDGDLEREILDGTKITKMTAANTVKGIFTANGCGSNNSSKSVPCMTVDLFGDWREELILRTDDNQKLRIWCTTDPTKVRLTTLMHDMQYRAQNACQQSSYNQPPHVSYYLGSDAPLPARPDIRLNNAPQAQNPSQPATEPATEPTVQPSVTEWNGKFDLGANAQNGFTSVKASEKYDKGKGYGFSGNDVKDVAAAGRNELSDAVQFTGNTTFNVDLPNGLYRVKVTLGNTARTSVYMENMLQIVNMTGNNAVDEILVPVTDGQLNIRAAAGKEGYAYTISSIEITKVSDQAVLPPTIWICGDSTVCNYYPLNTSTQAGWGQMLGNHVDKSWNIRNMAASGQYAKGFIDAGQFTAIEQYGKPGDVYIISIGINDSKYYKGDEYKKYITDMTKRAKAKGMEVILVKQQGRNGDVAGNVSKRWFSDELDQVAKAENVRVIDLFTPFKQYCAQIGADKTTALYMNGDALHPNRAGADKLAELFAAAAKLEPGTQATEPTTQPTQPTQPENPQNPQNPAVTVAEPENPETFIYGDLNFDGVVDVFDMAIMKRQLTAGALGRNGLRRADVDADGKVSLVDAVALQKYLTTGAAMPAFAAKTGFSYAIDQTVSKGVQENTNKGFRENAYVNLDNETGSALEWTVFAQEDGNYLCSFGTANGSAANRQMKIEVDGSADYWMQDFLTTGDWTTWEERGIVLPLHKGRNTIRLTSATAEGGPNFDYLRTEWTYEPAAEVFTEAKAAPVIQKVDGRTIYIAGDSTVQTYKASDAPQQGWGAYLADNLPQGVTISNQAIAGRSSKSFYDNGRLDTILGTIKKDDYLLIQFAINDAGSNKPERYAPTCGKVPGTAGSYEDYMAKYIEGAREKGATPVLVTTVIGLKSMKDGKFVGSYTNYCDSMRMLADYYQIPLIDLNSLMVDHYNQIGYDAAYKYHMCSTGTTDMTHFTEAGARAAAKLVADEMVRQGLV